MSKFHGNTALAMLFLSLGLGLTGGATSAQAQATGERFDSRQVPCPRPIMTRVPVTIPTANNGDFHPAQWNAPRAGLNDPSTDKHFLGRFEWRPEGKCCEITSGRLTVNLKANSAGSGWTDNAAGNDGFNIMAGGVSLPGGPPAPIYPNGLVAPGQTVTVTWILNAAALSRINQGQGLSFDVQDDTMVVSAQLELSGCCLNK